MDLWPALCSRAPSQGLPCYSPPGLGRRGQVKGSQCLWDLGHLWPHGVLHRYGAMNHMEGQLRLETALRRQPWGCVP